MIFLLLLLAASCFSCLICPSSISLTPFFLSLLFLGRHHALCLFINPLFFFSFRIFGLARVELAHFVRTSLSLYYFYAPSPKCNISPSDHVCLSDLVLCPYMSSRAGATELSPAIRIFMTFMHGGRATWFLLKARSSIWVYQCIINYTDSVLRGCFGCVLCFPHLCRCSTSANSERS